MKRLSKSMHGVTLLEIMLVLAIAAMIIVMSVRYYQSANSSQQANALLQTVQGITAAADSLAQASGGYNTGGVTTANLGPLVPGGTAAGFPTPWGSQITVAGATANTYSVTIPSVPQAVCALFVSKLSADKHYAATPSDPAACPAGATSITYTYTANP
jgi:type II secretory pathway pseudopilin PulG